MNTYFYKALAEIKPSTALPNKENLFDWFTLNDSSRKPPRFLTKPIVAKQEKENLDELYTNRTVTCRKCGKNETYRENKQTRGGDEGETFFYKCKYCKIRV